MSVTVDLVRDVFSYDQESGLLVFKKHYHRRLIGTSPRTTEKDGYLVCILNGRKYFVHRLVWLHAYGCWPKGQIDHINRSVCDNRLANLRDVTAAQNQHNQAFTNRKCNSGLLGAHRNNKAKCWQSTITVHGRAIYLGLFKTPELAHAAYVAAKAQLHPSNPAVLAAQGGI